MKAILILVLGLLILGAPQSQAQTVVIDSLDSSGKLTATVPSNSVYSVEWIGALDSTNGWQQGWSHLRDQNSEDGSVDVEVPMAFRLTCWTNGLFLNAPVGRTFHYSVSNQVGQTWTQLVEVVANAYIPGVSNSYRMVRVEEFYAHADFVPVGAQTRTITLFRSEEDRSFRYDTYNSEEVNDWRDGPNGTQWSFFTSAAETTIDSVITNHEDVVIGTTNYTGCVKIFSEGQDNGFVWQQAFPDRRYNEWIKPGGYIVKRENWWVHESETNATPIVYELQGWTDK